MGFPDTWLLGTAPRGRDGRFLGAYWEKTTSVYPARWVMGWVHDCLNGSPGPLTDVIDISEDWHKTAALVWPESV